MTTRITAPPGPDEAAIERTILELVAARAGGTICPSEVARSLVEASDWRACMPHVRSVAARLARAGRIVVTQRGRPVDAEAARGPIRLGPRAAGPHALARAQPRAQHDGPRRARASHHRGDDMDTPIGTDLGALKARQQTAWASGDYAVIGTTLQIVGETLAEACDLRCDERVLDVAAGNGNATLAAARRGGIVTSTDYVQALLDRGAERARAERLTATFETADAEALPYEDASFDVVLSTFGVMFAPDHARCAAEMARVCRPGGRIALANWTPDGFVGRLFKVLGRHVPPPAGVQPPSLWGTEPHLRALFGDTLAALDANQRSFNFRYRSAGHFVDVFRSWYGPVHKAFGTLDRDGAGALERDLTTLLDEMNVAAPDSLVVPSAYLEAVITRR